MNKHAPHQDNSRQTPLVVSGFSASPTDIRPKPPYLLSIASKSWGKNRLRGGSYEHGQNKKQSAQRVGGHRHCPLNSCRGPSGSNAVLRHRFAGGVSRNRTLAWTSVLSDDRVGFTNSGRLAARPGVGQAIRAPSMTREEFTSDVIPTGFRSL